MRGSHWRRSPAIIPTLLVINLIRVIGLGHRPTIIGHGRLFDTFAAVQHPEEGDSGERWPHHLRSDRLAEERQDKLPRLSVGRA